MISAFLTALLESPTCLFNPECVEIAETTKVAAEIAEIACDIVAADPIDSNYTTVAQPIFAPLPPLPTGTNKNVVQAYNYLFKNQNMQMGYFVAMKTALNRSQGAAAASDLEWQQTQLLAAKKFASQLAILQEGEPILLYLFDSALHADGTQSIAIDPAQVNTLLQSIAQNGFPASTTQQLIQLGFTADEIKLVQSMPQTAAITSAPSYPDLFTDSSLLTAIRQTQQASLPFIADRNNDLVVDCNDLQIVKASLGKKTG